MLLRRRPLESGEQRIDVVRVVVPDTVDVEGRRSVDAAPNAAHEVLAHARGMDVSGELCVEPLDVEPELLGVRVEVRVAQAALPLVENIVHPPELALSIRGFGCLGGLFGVRM